MHKTFFAIRASINKHNNQHCQMGQAFCWLLNIKNILKEKGMLHDGLFWPQTDKSSQVKFYSACQLLFPDLNFKKMPRKKEGFCAIGCCCTKRILWNKHFPRFVAFKPDLYRIWTYSQDLNPKNPHLAFLNTLQVNLMAKLPNTMLVFIALEADLALWWRTSF